MVSDLHGFDFTVNSLIGTYENNQEALKWHGEKLSNDIMRYKKSDTIFILGSGPSINDITIKEWDHISQNDSIGFNYWMAHDFVPDIYMWQDFIDNMFHLLSDKYIKYKNIPFIITGGNFPNVNYGYTDERLNLLKKNPLYYLNEYPIHSKCSIEPQLLFRYMEVLGYMKYNQITDFIPKWRSTLGLVIMLCYQMGYKKIVLCGMDMQKSDHFWDYEPYLEVKKKYSLVDKGVADVNLFADESHSKNSVPRYVYNLRDWMYEKNKVKMYIMKKKTVLFPEIELYTF